MIATGTLPDAGPSPDPFAPITNADDERWYPYPPTGELLDSATTIIGGTDAKRYLLTWAGSVSMAWAIDNMDLLKQTLKTGGRKAAIDLGKGEAKRLREVKADAGKYIHDVMESLILWAAEPKGTRHHRPYPEIPEHLQNAFYDGEPLADVVAAMADGFVQWVVDFDPEFLATEMQVYYYDLGVAGTLDMIVVLTGYDICNGHNCHERVCPGTGSHVVAAPGCELTLCIDGKTGREPDGAREQLAVYRRCPECRPDKLDTQLYPTPKTRAGAVLHLRKEYPGGYLLMIVAADDDNEAWETFQAAAKTFRDRQKRKGKVGHSVRPLRPDGTMTGIRICDLAAQGYGYAIAPLRKALGADCELEHLATFTEADVRAVKGVGPKVIEIIRQMLADNGLSLADDPASAGKAA